MYVNLIQTIITFHNLQSQRLLFDIQIILCYIILSLFI
ncbi:hypothetical protein VPHF99_0065 [Vibrio phage F99]